MNYDFGVIGEVHQDLYYETNFFESLIQKISKDLFQFLHYNPDDITTKLIEKIVSRSFSSLPKKIQGKGYVRRGGNGNNSSEYLARLGIPVRLISVIGNNAKWIIEELRNLGINIDNLFVIKTLTPISTIIKSGNKTKILVAPNLKEKMNFEGIKEIDDAFLNLKIAFITPLDEKYKTILNTCSKRGIITAFTIETQKIKNIDILSKLVNKKTDMLFINLQDARIITGIENSIDHVDDILKDYAKIRIYTSGKEGSHVITDTLALHEPALKLTNIIDLTGAGDCFAAGFLAKFYELIKNKEELNELLELENEGKLKNILSKCLKFGTYTAAFKITHEDPIEKDKLENFIHNFGENKN